VAYQIGRCAGCGTYPVNLWQPPYCSMACSKENGAGQPAGCLARLRAWVAEQQAHVPDPDEKAQLLGVLRRNLAREVLSLLDGDDQ
jgi:hypothetical protein